MAFTMDLSNQAAAIPVLGMVIEPLAAATVDTRMGAASLSDTGMMHTRVDTADIARAGGSPSTAAGLVKSHHMPLTALRGYRRTRSSHQLSRWLLLILHSPTLSEEFTSW